MLKEQLRRFFNHIRILPFSNDIASPVTDSVARFAYKLINNFK